VVLGSNIAIYFLRDFIIKCMSLKLFMFQVLSLLKLSTFQVTLLSACHLELHQRKEGSGKVRTNQFWAFFISTLQAISK
jgi:hypothetical protein